MSNQTITPGAGSLSLTFSVVVALAAGALGLAGYAPTASVATPSVVPSAGSVTTQGYAPGLSLAGGSNTTITPGTGAGRFTTMGLTVVTPGTGSAAITGNAPSLGINIMPGAASMTAAGFIPSQTLQLLPPAAGGLTLAGAAPTVVISYAAIVPGVDGLSLAGLTPSVNVTSGVVLTPGTGALATAGAQPSLGASISGATAALSWAGQAPKVGVSYAITPATGSMALGGSIATLNGAAAITPNAGSIVASGAAPVQAVVISPQTAALGLAGTSPSVGLTANQQIAPLPGGVVLSGNAAGLSGAAFITPNAGGILVVGAAPAQSRAIGVQPASLGLLGAAPSLVRTTNNYITPGAGSLSVTPQAGALSILALLEWPTRIMYTCYYTPATARAAGPLPYAEYFQYVGENLTYGIDWDGWLANYWKEGAMVPATLCVRPTVPNGYEYLTVLGGASGATEPTWPTTIGQSVTDGGVVWTCQAMDTTSLVATLQSAVWTAPGGVTVSNAGTSGQMTIATLSTAAATAGNNYTINCAAQMSDGEVKIGRILLKIR